LVTRRKLRDQIAATVSLIPIGDMDFVSTLGHCQYEFLTSIECCLCNNSIFFLEKYVKWLFFFLINELI